MVTPSKNISIEDVTIGLINACSNDVYHTPVLFQTKKLAEVLDTLKNSPEDIQKKIVDKKINLETAKKLNQFETVAQRD